MKQKTGLMTSGFLRIISTLFASIAISFVWFTAIGYLDVSSAKTTVINSNMAEIEILLTSYSETTFPPIME